MTTLKIGQNMRDRVSGFVGVASQKTEFLTGNIQFTLTPPAGGIFGRETQAFDMHQLEDAGAGVAAIAAPEDTGVELGQKVKDIVSGIEGIATMRTTFLNGCVYYTVALPAEKGATDIKEVFLEYKRLTKTGAGVRAQIAKRVKESETPTGGPAYRVPQRS